MVFEVKIRIEKIDVTLIVFCPIVGVKANTKSTHSDLSCRYCNGESTENQEHLEVCDGFRFERRGLNMDSIGGKLTFWRRCGGKLTAVAGGSPSGE